MGRLCRFFLLPSLCGSLRVSAIRGVCAVTISVRQPSEVPPSFTLLEMGMSSVYEGGCEGGV